MKLFLGIKKDKKEELSKMKLPNKTDNDFLNKVRFYPEYYPFSGKYDKKKNEELYKRAVAKGISADALSIISLGDYFHETYYKEIGKELVVLHKKTNLPHAELRELYVALLNEQELLNKQKYETHLNINNVFSAFDRQNAVFIGKDNPDNPQNFTAFSEALIEFGNLFFRYMAKAKEDVTKNQSLEEADVFKFLADMIHTTNKFYGIKSHYDSCLFRGGEIKLVNQNEIIFDSGKNDLILIEKIAQTTIENQKMNSVNGAAAYFKNSNTIPKMSTNLSNRMIDTVIISKGFATYSLKQRQQQDYLNGLSDEIVLENYYSFYCREPLKKLNNITISKLLSLDSETSLFIYMLYKKEFPNPNTEKMDSFVKNFVPKIKKNVLKGYLKNVSTCSDSEIEQYLKMTTAELTSSKLNLYATQLLSHEDYYYFPYFSATHRNTFFLVDYWLEIADEDMKVRGKALEKHLHWKLETTIRKKYNDFRVIKKSTFQVDKNNKEEIDLLIETKNTLIVGEIKCVKYPMYERDYSKIFNSVITDAVEQANRKAEFIIKHQDSFNEYSLVGKKIIKIVLLNYPVYSGIEIEGVYITDLTEFIAYFRSDKMSIWETGEEDKIINELFYYKSEDEFCNNFPSYIVNNPSSEMYKNQLQVIEASNHIKGLPKIIFTDVIPITQEYVLIEK
jgi:hypothetical protein